jgi:hypothetical protein
MFGSKLTRAEEMLLGSGLPLVMLLVYEIALYGRKESADYVSYIQSKRARKLSASDDSKEEQIAIMKENVFGLRVISFALIFTALLLFGISFIATSGQTLTLIISIVIFLTAFIPLRAGRKVRFRIAAAAGR